MQATGFYTSQQAKFSKNVTVHVKVTTTTKSPCEHMERVQVQDWGTISLVQCYDAEQRAVDIMPHTAGSYLLRVYFQTNPADRQTERRVSLLRQALL